MNKILQCTDCIYYRSHFYRNPKYHKKLDPRCIHRLAKLGSDSDSYMTPSEMRSPLSEEAKLYGFTQENPCGPNANLMVPIKWQERQNAVK